MHEVTRILSAIEQGDPQAAEQLLPLVYDELRKLAAQRLPCQEVADEHRRAVAHRPGGCLRARVLGSDNNVMHRLFTGDRLRASVAKRREIEQYYKATGPIAFVHVTLLDNRSDFLAPVQLRVRRSGDDFILELTGAVAVANTVAYLSELIDPISMFLGLTRQNLMTQSLRYFLFGEGEVALSVYSILIRYWEWTPEDDVRPLIFLMSE